MSRPVMCDGPGCTVVVDTNSGQALNWLTASRGLASFDFHSPECLAKWAESGAGVRTIPAPNDSRAALDDCTMGPDCTADLHMMACTSRIRREQVDGR